MLVKAASDILSKINMKLLFFFFFLAKGVILLLQLLLATGKVLFVFSPKGFK